MHTATEEEYVRGSHATKDNTIGWKGDVKPKEVKCCVCGKKGDPFCSVKGKTIELKAGCTVEIKIVPVSSKYCENCLRDIQTTMAKAVCKGQTI